MARFFITLLSVALMAYFFQVEAGGWSVANSDNHFTDEVFSSSPQPPDRWHCMQRCASQDGF